MKYVVPFPSKRPHVQAIPSKNAFCQQSESGPVATKVQSENEFFDELHQDTKNSLAGNLPAPVSTFALSRDAWRAQLLAAAEFKTSPLDYEETAGFDEAHLTRESYIATKNILTTFSVVKDPGLMTTDELVETLLSLAGGPGATISARAHPHFKKMLYDTERPKFGPIYARYIDALWAGDLDAIRECAEKLGLAQGVAKQTTAFKKL